MSGHWRNSITLHQLQLFAAVARERTFAMAAEALCLSEATVSDQVKTLEHLIGARLLNRSPGRRRVEVTEFGRLLLEGYTRAWEELESAVSKIEALQSADYGSVAFGAGPHFGGSVLPLVCTAFHQSNPGIIVRTEIDQREHLLESLRRRRLDLIVLVGSIEDYGLTSEPLAEYQVFLVGPYGHGLAGLQEPAPFAELASVPLILPSYTGLVRQQMERLATEAGITLNVVLEVANVEAQIQAVASGIGIAALTSYSARARIVAGQLSVLKVQGFPINLQWYVVYPWRHVTPAVRTFRSYLQQYMSTLAANTPDIGLSG